MRIIQLMVVVLHAFYFLISIQPYFHFCCYFQGAVVNNKNLCNLKFWFDKKCKQNYAML